MELKSFLQILSSVEKRYGRSIVDIRRQLGIWEEMISNQEVSLPEQALHVEVSELPVSHIAFPTPGDFVSVYDLMKSIVRFKRWKLHPGVDLSSVAFSRAEWRSFLMLLKATILDWNRIGLSVAMNSSSTLKLLRVASHFEELDFLCLNVFVSMQALSSLRERGQIELAGEDLTSRTEVSAEEMVGLINAVRARGALVRFVLEDAIRTEEVPGLGHRRVVSDDGYLLSPGEAVPTVIINLNRFVRAKGRIREVDWERLGDRVVHAVRLADDLIDLCNFPMREVYEVTRRLRRVSVAVAGWSELLFSLGLSYASDSAVELGAKVARFLKEKTDTASWELAKERGVFPAYRFSWLEKEGLKRRNVSVLTGGARIMPRRTLTEEGGVIPCLDEIARQRNFFSEEFKELLLREGSLQSAEFVPDDVKTVFVVYGDVPEDWKLRHQARFQEYWDGIVEGVRVEGKDFANSLWKASLFGGAGVLALPMASEKGQGQLVSGVGESSPREVSLAGDRLDWTGMSKRPEVLLGRTVKVQTACGPLLVTINQDGDGKVREVLLRLEKAGGCVASHLEALGKTLSLLFSAGAPRKVVIEALQQINCSSVGWHKGRRVYSCADAISQLLLEEEKLALDKDVELELEIN